jgi:uncharacterized protein (TIGR03083 family)
VDHERHLLALRHEAGSLAAAARRDLTQPVPSCPGWDLAAVVTHVGRAYRWVTEIVDTHAADEVRLDDVTGPDDTTDLVGWFEDALAALLETLTNETPDSPAWNWSEQDLTAAFWARRMAHETAVHAWDAWLANGIKQPIEPELATDGVDEMLGMIVPHVLGLRPVDGLAGTVRVTATDTGAVWYGALHPDGIDLHRGAPLAGHPQQPDATLNGTASNLVLAMWGRDVAIETSGDARIVAVLTE